MPSQTINDKTDLLAELARIDAEFTRQVGRKLPEDNRRIRFLERDEFEVRDDWDREYHGRQAAADHYNDIEKGN